jgi:hypothetical protein
MERKVLYTGKTNDYTFHDNIDHNAIGGIKNDFEINGRKMFQIEFNNGLVVTIDEDDVKIFPDNEG